MFEKKGIKLKKRRGMSLMELLGVMVVLAILALISIGAVTIANERARCSSASRALDAYHSAFLEATTTHPGFVSAREKAWPATGAAGYTAEAAYKRVVLAMNETLDDQLHMTWDGSLKCYVSAGEDPWGGKYILTEYPEEPGGGSWFDPTSDANKDTPRLCLSVWCTGNTDDVLVEHTVGKSSYGIMLDFSNGLVTADVQGFDKSNEFVDWTIKFQ